MNLTHIKPFYLKLLLLFIIISQTGPLLHAQEVVQTIRGTIVDSDTQMPLPGANVVLLNTNMGTTANANGEFRLEGVSVGRVNLGFSFIGFEDKVMSNILLTSSKELVLKIELTEALNKLDEIVVGNKVKKEQPLNEMALVSARTFSVEETKRYAGAIDDPARMVSSFAGVTNDPEGNNDIIVRGNSPRGVLWRLEGVDIPNPNHFSDEGGTGGPINALNSSMLGNSDFYTGAFAPQYGNALSAVFDMQLRKGNNQKREYSFQASTLGLDVTAEGPFKEGYRGSYLANYRYSSLSLLDAAGIVDFDGVPKYQDATFNVNLPVNAKNKLGIFGMGGISSIDVEEALEDDETFIVSKADLENQLGVLGLSHTYLLNEKAYLKSTLTGSGTIALFSYLERDSLSEFYENYTEDFVKSSLAASSIYHHKLNARNKFKLGFVYTHLGYTMQSKNFDTDDNRLETLLDADGNSASLQGFVEWKHRINNRVSLVGGMHYLQFMLNNDFAVEPRLAMKWELNDKQSITAGAGMHSRLESVAIYLGQLTHDDGTVSTPNTDLGLTKAAHFVLGYNRKLGDLTNLRAEVYYQNLFNVPVENEEGSYQSILNYGSGYTVDDLVNSGKGENYGVELTLEKFLNKGFYYLTTASVYQSVFTAKDGVQRSSAFDGRYVFNGLVGKEFKVGKAHKNKVLTLNTKVALIGGKPYTPVDIAASIAKEETVLQDDKPMSARGADIFKWDLAIGIRRNYKKVTTEWKIDVQNLTNNQAIVGSYYDDSTKSIEHDYQWSMFPTLSYRVTF